MFFLLIPKSHSPASIYFLPLPHTARESPLVRQSHSSVIEPVRVYPATFSFVSSETEPKSNRAWDADAGK